MDYPADEDSAERGPGPLVWCGLPDGHSVTPQLRARRQQPDGTWAYELELSLWAVVETPGRIGFEPDSVVFLAPAAKVTPIDGVDYRSVPTRRVPRTVRRKAGPEDRWSIQTMRRATGPYRILHHQRCWIPTTPAELTTTQAQRELTRPDTELCNACGADQLLRRDDGTRR